MDVFHASPIFHSLGPDAVGSGDTFMAEPAIAEPSLAAGSGDTRMAEPEIAQPSQVHFGLIVELCALGRLVAHAGPWHSKCLGGLR